MTMKRKINMDDGFNPELVGNAYFDGLLEIPKIEAIDCSIIPNKMIPINKLSATDNYSEIIVPYVYDNEFGDIVKNPQKYVDVFKKFPAIVSLDNSVYPNSPLSVQIANTYRNRALGYYFQSQGLNVIPNIRWGDERSYTTCLFPERFAFLGAPKNSILCVGTYGACKTKEEKHHLRHGLIAMLDTLTPKTVLIYGAMPDEVFHGLYQLTRFIKYPDWTSYKKEMQ